MSVDPTTTLRALAALRRPFGRRILGAFLVVALLPLAVIGVLGERRIEAQIRDQLDGEIQMTAHLQASELQQWLAAITEDLNVTGSERVVRAWLHDESAPTEADSTDAGRAVLMNLRHELTADRVALVNAAGRIMVTDPPSELAGRMLDDVRIAGTPLDVAARRVLARTTAQVASAEGTTDGRLGSVAVPIHAPDHALLGVIAADLPMSSLASALIDVEQRDLSTRTGVVRSSADGGTLEVLTMGGAGTEPGRAPPTIESTLRARWQSALARRQWTGAPLDVLTYSHRDGTEWHGVVQPVPILGERWGVVAEAPVSDLALATAERRQSFFGLSAAMAALAVLIAVVLTGRIAQPLQDLAVLARRIADGDDVTVPPPTRHDEIGELTDSLRDLVTSMRASLDAERRGVGALEVQRAASERSRASAERGEARLRAILAAIPDAVFTLNLDGVIHDVNPAAEAMIDSTTAELVGVHVERLAPALPAALKRVIEAADDGRDTPMRGLELDFVRTDGTRLPVELVLSPPMHGGRRVTAVARDLTERRAAEAELLELTEHLEQTSARANEMAARAEMASASKSEFLANMSHEIRTPMTAILGFTENLLESELDETLRLQAAHTIRRNGEHLLEIINDILDISKIEAGRMEVESIECDPVRLVADVLSLMSVRAETRNLALELAFDGVLPRTIQSDPTRLRQILVNLVGNAIKFTEHGSVTLRTTLVTDEDGAPGLRFDVIDTGIGMTDAQMGRLFSAFSQADTSTTRRFGGTGLGLMISQRLATMLGGGITVSSTPGEGSCFSATISTGALDGVTMLDDPASAVLEAPETAPTAPLNGDLGSLRILLADDGIDNQRLIRHVLDKAGADDVVVVGDGEAAMNTALDAAANDEPFDVILLDMQMPIMDGYEAVGQLRARGYDRPVIALTAHAMASDRRKCIDAGCDEYATKPIDRAALIAVIRAQATRHQRRAA